MMTSPLTFDELARIVATYTGGQVNVAPDTPFDVSHVGSGCLVAVIAEREHRFGMPLGAYAEKCNTPRELIEFANSQVTSGA